MCCAKTTHLQLRMCQRSSIPCSTLNIVCHPSQLPLPGRGRNAHYGVMANHSPPHTYLTHTTHTHTSAQENEVVGPNRVVVPFIACGDLRGFDSDTTYVIEDSSAYRTLPPAQPPIKPPYQTALDIKHSASAPHEQEQKGGAV